MAGLESQQILETKDIGEIALSNGINHAFGVQAELLLTAPAGARLLYLRSEIGAWRVQIGDRSIATGDSEVPSVASPVASVTDGSGSLPLLQGESIVIPSPTIVTVASFDAADVLTYYYL